jgi:phosphate/phosphite/phosphonate ABC transporter binding protein
LAKRLKVGFSWVVYLIKRITPRPPGCRRNRPLAHKNVPVLLDTPPPFTYTNSSSKGFIVHRFLIAFLFCFILLSVGAQGECKLPEEGRHKKEIVIGLVPEQNIFRQIERYTPLAEYLSRKTGLKIKLKVMTSYGEIVDNFVSSEMDGAFGGSLTYALAHNKIGLEVLARPEGLDGKTTCNGLIFVRQDSGISSITDMKGKRFVFVHKASTTGYLFPLVYFKQKGLLNYQGYFKETYCAGTHEDAIRDVLNRMPISAQQKTRYWTGWQERMPISARN